MFWQEKETMGHPHYNLQIHILEGPFPRPQTEAIPLSEGGISVPQPVVTQGMGASLVFPSLDMER